MTIRTLWLKAHLWVGLAIAVPLILVALSGAVLVFEGALDRALNPAVSFVTPGEHSLPLDELIARARAAYPEAQLNGLSLPESPDVALQISASMKPRGAFAIAINPYTGQILGTRSGVGLVRRIHLLHTRLFAGEIGEWIVGAVTALTLFMAVAGLVLWWPRKILTVKMTASGRRVNFDLHNVFGFYASAVFLFIALTGMMISFESWTDPMFLRLNDAPVPQLARESTIIPGARPLSADTLARTAAATLPGAFVKNLGVPDGGRNSIVAFMKFPEDRTPAGRSRVVLDQYSGAVLTVVSTRTVPIGSKLINIKRSAHTGDIFGAFTRGLYFITALMLAGQVMTGLFIWWKRPAQVARDRT
jgi:uncharacterized iron-regulated membrane protein